jgi:hypothetical protein
MNHILRVLGGSVILAAALLPAGCMRSRGAPPATTQQQAAAQSTRPGRVKRILDKTKARAYMHQIGILYQAYITDNNNKPPAKLDDFLAYIQRDSRDEYRMLKEGSFAWNAKAGTDSNKVLCYEKDPDLDDNRIVLMGDGSVEQMSTADLDKALPEKDR